jgi:hypothetical protein
MSTKEEPKRLAPTGETARELFLKSGNLCAFSNCTHLMMNEKGDFIGEICHIEGVKPKGERFNADMSNEDRRHFNNLMLMCHKHHVETEDEDEFTVKRLQNMKREHEKRFSAPDRAILDTLIDWTATEKITGVKNLRRMSVVMNDGLGDEELAINCADLNAYLQRFTGVPLEARRLLAAIAQRMHVMEKTAAVRNSPTSHKILVSDLTSAFQVRRSKVLNWIEQLESYGLGGVDQIDTDLGPKGAVAIYATDSGWHFWTDLAAYCAAAGVSMDEFSEKLNFSALDD